MNLVGILKCFDSGFDCIWAIVWGRCLWESCRCVGVKGHITGIRLRKIWSSPGKAGKSYSALTQHLTTLQQLNSSCWCCCTFAVSISLIVVCLFVRRNEVLVLFVVSQAQFSSLLCSLSRNNVPLLYICLNKILHTQMCSSTNCTVKTKYKFYITVKINPLNCSRLTFTTTVANIWRITNNWVGQSAIYIIHAYFGLQPYSTLHRSWNSSLTAVCWVGRSS